MGYLKKDELPPVVAIACRAMARDKHILAAHYVPAHKIKRHGLKIAKEPLSFATPAGDEDESQLGVWRCSGPAATIGRRNDRPRYSAGRRNARPANNPKRSRRARALRRILPDDRAAVPELAGAPRGNRNALVHGRRIAEVRERARQAAKVGREARAKIRAALDRSRTLLTE